MKNKIGVFGGSFNPIHVGHIILANDVLEEFKLDKILFVPAFEPPLKSPENLVDYELRYKMVSEAIKNFPRLIVSDIESKLPKPSYTINTLNALRTINNDWDLYLIVGADQADQFDKWKNIEEIVEISHIIIMNRRDIPLNDKYLTLYQKRQIDISSTEIRNRIKNNMTYKQFLPESVSNIIQDEKLYE